MQVCFYAEYFSGLKDLLVGSKKNKFNDFKQLFQSTEKCLGDFKMWYHLVYFGLI